MKVLAIQKHPYAGIERKVGQQYDLEDQYVDIMVAYGNVVVLEEPAPVSGKQYVSRKDVQAEQPPAKYKRRDMKAN